MEEIQRANIVHNILANRTTCRIDGRKYIIHEPSEALLCDAIDLHFQVLDRHKYDDILNREQALLLLVREQLWTMDGDRNFAIINQSISDLKVSLFKSFYKDSKTCEKLRKRLAMVKQKETEMYQIRYQFDHFTLEGLADSVQKHFIFLHTVCDANDNRLWDSPACYDPDLVDRLILEYARQLPNEAMYRELARTTPWNSHWAAYKKSLKPVHDSRLESLVAFSTFYDSIRQNPECPSDDIIADDDALDGWMIEQQKESDKKGNKKMSKSGVPTSGEIFLPARNQKEAQQIFEQNAPEVRTRQKLRSKYINDKGEVADGEMPDVRRDLAMDASRQAAETIRQRKG